MLCVSGSSCGWNQWRGAADAMDWVEGRKHIVNKATKCMPLINRGPKAAWWARPWRWLDAAEADGKRGIWLNAPLDATHLVPVAVEMGFGLSLIHI